MTTERFRPYLLVFDDTMAGYVCISSAGEASDFLFRHWPGHNTPIWFEAMRCCNGESGIEEAQAAFAVALQGAGIDCKSITAAY
jgi:hypothetical protein